MKMAIGVAVTRPLPLPGMYLAVWSSDRDGSGVVDAAQSL